MPVSGSITAPGARLDVIERCSTRAGQDRVQLFFWNRELRQNLDEVFDILEPRLAELRQPCSVDGQSNDLKNRACICRSVSLQPLVQPSVPTAVQSVVMNERTHETCPDKTVMFIHAEGQVHVASCEAAMFHRITRHIIVNASIQTLKEFVEHREDQRLSVRKMMEKAALRHPGSPCDGSYRRGTQSFVRRDLRRLFKQSLSNTRWIFPATNVRPSATSVLIQKKPPCGGGWDRHFAPICGASLNLQHTDRKVCCLATCCYGSIWSQTRSRGGKDIGASASSDGEAMTLATNDGRLRGNNGSLQDRDFGNETVYAAA